MHATSQLFSIEQNEYFRLDLFPTDCYFLHYSYETILDFF
jgi:hypothetical protein